MVSLHRSQVHDRTQIKFPINLFVVELNFSQKKPPYACNRRPWNPNPLVMAKHVGVDMIASCRVIKGGCAYGIPKASLRGLLISASEGSCMNNNGGFADLSVDMSR